jgi:hypothetical protein
MDFRKRVWTGFDCLRIGAGGELVCGDEPSGSCATEIDRYYFIQEAELSTKHISVLSPTQSGTNYRC